MTTMGNLPEVVSREEWLAARKELLVKEKEVTRARDRVNADRRRLPMVRMDKPYTFEGPEGTVSLLDLFEGRPQLVMHHFMFGPDWEQGCPSCSSAADGIGRLRQLHVRNTTLVAVSRAPYAKLAPYRERMGWSVPWYTITDDFDEDFGVDEWHGTNAFIREGDRIFRSYFVNDRGDEAMGSTWSYLDITALGRQEEWEDSPPGYPQTPPYQWWRLHDEYPSEAAATT